MKKIFVFIAVAIFLTGCSGKTDEKKEIRLFHLGEWENQIGYSQSATYGDRIVVSGTVGDTVKSKTMEAQMKDAYDAILVTLKSENAGMNDVIKETIYCTSMDDLIKCQEARKKIYNGHLPAATWVEVKRLYGPDHLIEIEVEAVIR